MQKFTCLHTDWGRVSNEKQICESTSGYGDTWVKWTADFKEKNAGWVYLAQLIVRTIRGHERQTGRGESRDKSALILRVDDRARVTKELILSPGAQRILHDSSATSGAFITMNDEGRSFDLRTKDPTRKQHSCIPRAWDHTACRICCVC